MGNWFESVNPCWLVIAPSLSGVEGSSYWEVERTCLVRNPRPPPPTSPSETEFEEVDP